MSESEIKARFVYNFLKFVEWPADTPRVRGPLVVVIIGDGPTARATEQFLEAKAIGDRPVTIRRLRWDESLEGAHAAFVSEQDERKLQRILRAATVAEVLTIGEGDDFTVFGGVIGLVVENRRVRFDVDTTAAKFTHLRVSSKLLALTRVVRSSPDRTGQETR